MSAGLDFMSGDSMPYDVNAAFESARLLHEAGQLEQARSVYEHILSIEPAHADTLHLLGVMAHQAGDHRQAIKLIQQAIDAAPRPVPAIYYNNMGSALRAAGRHQDAMIAFSLGIHVDKNYAPGYFNLGVAMSGQGDWEAALQRFSQALDLKPDFADAHYNKAIAEKQLGRPREALASFREVLRLQPGNGLAQHYVALLSGAASERAPDEYVTSIFDGNAEEFDRHLVQQLQYDTPQRLVEMLKQHAKPSSRQWAVLDLGCGTGLVGAAIAPFAHYVVGVDLSPKMLEKARTRGVYARLEQSELQAMMDVEAEVGAVYDVITSADVFIYIGKLDRVFQRARGLLKPGGYFAFSAESLDALPKNDGCGTEDYRLNPSGRYAHAAAYLKRLAGQSGFAVEAMASLPARLEGGQPVQAWLVLCQTM
ncbi:tetratricopeptide repeat protein [Undibacterium terreum]|uniref:Methyltransferase type 12 domain-containing protein n=1 Tax=Undibacterium terreum TaxID=1224302 RepID=A0A916U6A7_9BURK|nr:tetratricopeptide repeat protein [Undibacterium terreum]GGC61849.1 hypothetical protein GCM10011396_05940 [Undibacterium terreum]